MTTPGLVVDGDDLDDLLQRQVLLTYVELYRRHTSWASRLVLLEGSGAPHFSLQYAGLLLGALSLSVSEDAESLKAGLRKGAFDFVVNSVDEALRILKNEARRGRPVSVALSAEADREFAELRKRGVRVELVVAPRVTEEHRSRVYRFVFKDLGERRRFDQGAAEYLHSDNDAGRRWLQLAEQVLPRVRPVQRLLSLSQEEAARLETWSANLTSSYRLKT